MVTSPVPAPGDLRPTSVVGVDLGTLQKLVGGRLIRGSSPEQLRLTGITLRAQDVRPGDLFAALPGTRVHGAEFAPQAVEAGARAVVTDPAGGELLAAVWSSRSTLPVPLLVVDDVRAGLGALSCAIYGDPSRRLEVIAVTGTSGKTTTGYLLEAALTAGGARVGLIGTVATRIAGRATKSLLTTPEAPDLQALFAVMVEQGVTAVAMEVSSHALSLGRVAGTTFAVGAFTNLSQDHLDFHPDMESYFRAKAMLFDGRAAAGVIDVDDEYGRRLARMHPEAVTVSALGDPTAAWSVTGIEASRGGHQHFRVRRPGGESLEVRLALPGHFNVANAVVALACIDASGGDVATAARALASVVVPGRMERVDAGQDFLVVVDYAHKPAALTAVLQAISVGLAGRLIVVIGAGGNRDAGKRPMMGAAAAALADELIVTDDNPRSEEPAVIRAAILSGTAAGTDADRVRPGSARVREVGDRRAAIRQAVAAARTGDVVVIAGKGHEQGQDVGGVVHPFSDRAEVIAALTAHGFGGPSRSDRQPGPLGRTASTADLQTTEEQGTR